MSAGPEPIDALRDAEGGPAIEDLPERRAPVPQEWNEHDPPDHELDLSDDDPGPETVSTGQRIPLGPR